MRRILLALGLCCASTATFAAPAFKGMSYTSFNTTTDLLTSASDQSIANMKTLGVNTVALNVWWFQSDVHQTTIAPTSGTSTATFINNVQHAIDSIHAQGMNVFLKPMLDVSDGTWRAYINPSDANTWFGYNATTNPYVDANTAPSAGSYGAFIDTMADLAHANSDKVSMFSVGCELNNMEQNDQNWRNLIDNVRTHYSGPLTYSANWSTAGASPKDPISVGGGYNNISWWNKFDAARGDEVGIDAYFPVGSSPNTTLAGLTNSWTTEANTIDNWRTTAGVTDKRLFFTETGYASYDGAASTPYASPASGSTPVDEQEQADAYQAQLNVMSQEPWWDGAMWWNWETSPNSDSGNGYSPQNKLVQDVLAGNYGGTVPAFSLSNWTTASASATFSTAGNWAGGTPNLNFVAQFSRGAAATYTVTFSNSPTVDQLRVGSNTVTFQPSATTTARILTVDDWHTNTAGRGIIIAPGNGDVGVVNVLRNGSANMTLTCRAATIGDVAGANGALNVNNTTFNVIGSDVSNTELIIGRGGSGSLLVQGGGKVNVNGAAGDATIGDQAGSVGAATVTGAGSSWTTTGTLSVGRLGQGMLTVANSGTVTAPTVSVGTGGTIKGDGTIVGAIQNSGIVAPGLTIGALHVTGTYTQLATGQLQLEIGGRTPGTQYDQLLVSGVIVFDGSLQVTLDSFSPTVGDSFNIIDSGFAPLTTFAAVNLPALGSNLVWDQSQLYNAGVLSVISTLPGDYNRNGVVDAADYTVWRDTFGEGVPNGTGADSDGDGLITQDDYNFWSLHFGDKVGSLPGAGAGARAAIPEPSTAILALLALSFAGCRVRAVQARRGRAVAN